MTEEALRQRFRRADAFNEDLQQQIRRLHWGIRFVLVLVLLVFCHFNYDPGSIYAMLNLVLVFGLWFFIYYWILK